MQAAKGKGLAIFLDRDGTIIVERQYLADPAKVELMSGAVAALITLAAAGYSLVLVTNQSGIARGFYTEADYHAVQARLDELLEQQGLQLDGVFYCPHHPDFTGPCSCRKPGPDLYLAAARELNLDLSRSAFVGDKLSDVLPALELGGLGVLVRTGYGAAEAAEAPPGIRVAEDLAEAVQIVLNSSAAAGPGNVH